MHSRFLGGILLIVGTSIGGGMLALPVANAATGFWQSSLFLFICWIFMTLGAFFILEANLYLPRGTHMISMAAATLGNTGILVAWVSYLFLLYTLLSAYISGGADVLNSLLLKMGVTLANWQVSLLFTFLFGLIVYGGIRYVDYVNRALMFGKLAIYVLLVILITPHIDVRHFQHGHWRYIGASIMILITSFGFAIIVPNLRDYFDDDIKLLKKVIFIGSLIPLFCYLAWDAIIMGAIPAEGNQNLESLMQNPHTTSALADLLAQQVQSITINAFFNFFTSICMLTAFLGVSLCLYSFLADGLKLRDEGGYSIGLFLLTFAPPLLIVIYYPGAYIHALGYAGIFCIILLLLLPALMCYFGRKNHQAVFTVPGGKITQYMVMLVSFALLAHEVYMLWP
ncbi:MAG: aromatic amino acid transport family protein [Legionella sp.]|uniref:amino acid permease n=1 Tax=Legionella sp. TaxID=459 RepID=UPI0039E51633